MDSTNGLGRPSPGQPDFDRPDESVDLGHPEVGGVSGWVPPSGDPAGTVAGPDRSPRGRRPRLVLVTSAVLVVALLVTGTWLLFAPRPTANAPAATSPAASAPASAGPSVLRTQAAPRPTTSAPVSGGGIGQAQPFGLAGGEGRVTLTGAAWVDNGVLPPHDGTAYLVLAVDFEGVSGAVSTGGFFVQVRDAGDTDHLQTVGAQLETPLAMRTLRPGERNTGQVAFELARGAVTFQVLDEKLEPVASIEIPG